MRIAALGAAVVVVSACIPSRDNPQDSKNAPEASFVILEQEPLSTGGCATVSSGGAPVLTASRGACLVLDGRESESPGGGALSERWAWIGSNGELNAIDECDDAERCALPVALLRTMPAGDGAQVELRLRVEKANGGHHAMTRPLGLTNVAPRPAVPAPLFLPREGLPWLAGAPAALTFRGTAVDADGDVPARWCWTFPPALAVDTATALDPAGEPETVCNDGAVDPGVTRYLAPSGAQTLRPTLTVSDDRATSAAVTAIVHVDVAAMWGLAAPFEWFGPGVSTTVRFDATRQHVETLPNDSASTAELDLELVDVGDDSFVAVSLSRVVGFFERNTIALYRVSDPRVRDVVNFGGGQPTEARSFGDKLVTVSSIGGLYPGATSISPYQAVVDTAGGVNLAPLPAYTPIPGDYSKHFDEMAIDGNGTAWLHYAGDGDQIARRIVGFENGNFLPSVAPAAGAPILVESRPGTSEVWALEQPDGDADPVLVQYEGGVALRTIALEGMAGAHGPVWIDESRFWLLDRGVELLQLDANALAAGASLLDAITLEVPEVFTGTPEAADPRSGDLYLRHDTTITRVSFDGTRIEHFAYQTNDLVVDTQGRLWLDDGNGGLETGFEPRRDGVAHEVAIDGQYGEIGVDMASSSAWVPVNDPPGLYRVASDGSYEFFDTIEVGEPPIAQTMPGFFHPFRVGPDGRSAWAMVDESLGSNGITAIWRIDLTARPLRATPLPDLALVMNDLSYHLLEPFAPIAGGGPELAWAFDVEAAELLQLPLSGPPIERGAVFGGYYARGARDVASNDLCFFSPDDDTGTSVSFRRIDAVSGELVYEALDAPTFYSFGNSVGAVSAHGEQCWYSIIRGFGINETYTSDIVMYDAPGAPALSLPDIPGTISSIWSPAPNLVWVTVMRPHPITPDTFNHQDALLRIEFDELGAASVFEMSPIPSVRLAAPDAYRASYPD